MMKNFNKSEKKKKKKTYIYMKIKHTSMFIKINSGLNGLIHTLTLPSVIHSLNVSKTTIFFI